MNAVGSAVEESMSHEHTDIYLYLLDYIYNVIYKQNQ